MKVGWVAAEPAQGQDPTSYLTEVKGLIWAQEQVGDRLCQSQEKETRLYNQNTKARYWSGQPCSPRRPPISGRDPSLSYMCGALLPIKFDVAQGNVTLRLCTLTTSNRSVIWLRVFKPLLGLTSNSHFCPPGTCPGSLRSPPRNSRHVFSG